MPVRIWCLLLLALVSSCARPLAVAGSSDELSFTTAQAERGSAIYGRKCASCHGENLDGGRFGLPLTGLEFRAKWGQQSAEPLFTYIETRMPPSEPGSIGKDGTADVLAFIFKSNGSPPGPHELLTDAESLKNMSAPPWDHPIGGYLVRNVPLPPAPPRANPLERITPVTDTMLERPSDGDWLSWRRTYDAYGFSPLKKINRTNAKRLRLAWSWALSRGVNQTAPLVHDGALFVYGSGDTVQALDAATGDLLWQYRRHFSGPMEFEAKRAIAIYGTRIYAATADTHVIALDAKTGKPAWDTRVADYKSGYFITGGPLVARGKIMVGTASTSSGGNFVVALDAETGKEAWRVRTIALPGEPGGNTWNDAPPEQRNGGGVWLPGSYDVVNRLALFGTGNTYDPLPLLKKTDKPGVTNEGLYLESTLAIDPDTGKRVWYFQHQANDQWDLDWAFERQVVELKVDGVARRLVVTAGKQMIFDFLEAKTGRYVKSLDIGREAGLQNLVTAIDSRTGAKTLDPGLLPVDGKTRLVCPHITGGRNWMPTSFDSSSGTLYVPWNEACMETRPRIKGETGGLSANVSWNMRPKPGSDGKYGRLQAIDLRSGKTRWLKRQRAPMVSGALATAGGLVFAGSLDRMFSAHDARTGQRLWQARLNDIPASMPMSYSAGGKQYVAVIAGGGNRTARSMSQLVPELRNPAEPGSTLWVFEQ